VIATAFELSLDAFLRHWPDASGVVRRCSAAALYLIEQHSTTSSMPAGWHTRHLSSARLFGQRQSKPCVSVLLRRPNMLLLAGGVVCVVVQIAFRSSAAPGCVPGHVAGRGRLAARCGRGLDPGSRRGGISAIRHRPWVA